uniref:Uncharacterized protein n=1 Tax=Helicotheca tamesis TaxID=374047 RepID=A0A7S2DY46_9STRA|mmetsp:Transcript_10776/g.15025  ORF Transcript_10776/g.15025 Transcript_10776/m.15025 type:complete len:189 (+) Transcript_10776:158-724(+)|eukprot:CAMPEP_0185732118 /NCGR_PEP_ID=MMETSP1171-20130828/15077_1 /TAXON_ID=374046 /ORGANISM="Helicotheca tamensis, Strain CCMP826" /LENGTH=188 /DNA_ID=CAMNT_0028401529 /DNA_START=92 /DNA_END=658 /DNA_ORIENTATION=+
MTESTAKGEEPPPPLVHDSLKKIPLNIRFALTGTLSNAIFLTGYNTTLHQLSGSHTNLPDAYIYSIFYLFFIPISHLLQCLFVWGWPNPYLPSLLSNAPIGLTAMALGTVLTGYLDQIEFNEVMEDFLRDHFAMLAAEDQGGKEEEDETTNYVSYVVMIATGLWGYVLSVLVNTPKTTTKKEEKEKEL